MAGKQVTNFILWSFCWVWPNLWHFLSFFWETGCIRTTQDSSRAFVNVVYILCHILQHRTTTPLTLLNPLLNMNIDTDKSESNLAKISQEISISLLGFEPAAFHLWNFRASLSVCGNRERGPKISGAHQTLLSLEWVSASKPSESNREGV